MRLGGFVFFRFFFWVDGICGSFAERKPPGLKWLKLNRSEMGYKGLS